MRVDEPVLVVHPNPTQPNPTQIKSEKMQIFAGFPLQHRYLVKMTKCKNLGFGNFFSPGLHRPDSAQMVRFQIYPHHLTCLGGSIRVESTLLIHLDPVSPTRQ